MYMYVLHAIMTLLSYYNCLSASMLTTNYVLTANVANKTAS